MIRDLEGGLHFRGDLDDLMISLFRRRNVGHAYGSGLWEGIWQEEQSRVGHILSGY